MKPAIVQPISKDHWDDLYCKLYEVYDDCGKNFNETYRQKIGEILDHMITNKPHLYIK